MADLAYIQTLADELTNDPLGLGYVSTAGVDWQNEANALADLATLTTANRTVDVETLSGSQLFEAIDDTEWQARTADQKTDIQFVVGLGDNIQISPGTKARAMMARALTGATASLSNLGTLGSKTVTRAEELGLSGLKIGHIQLARRA